MMKNVRVAYILSFLWRSWFWLGVWIFYYLRFTDYAGIGFLEAVMITTASLGEIPTGAIADIFGKKPAVSFAFLMSGIGNLIMAFAPNYSVLLLSVITMTLGGAFYSGSLEALVYDSLIEEKKVSEYKKVIGRMTTMQNLGMAVAGIAGGYMYQLNVSLPFIMVAIAYAIGFVFSFQLIEPKVDTQKYSWKMFVAQNKEGLIQLFSHKKISYMVWLLLIPSAFMLATENVINDATALQLGFNSIQLGIFATILYLFGVVVSEKSEWLMNKFNSKMFYLVLIVLYVLTLVTMPIVGFWIGVALLLARYGAQTVFHNYRSVRLNAVIDSQYRATTLSTFSLIEGIPYILGATFVGEMMNIYGAKSLSMYFGVALMISLLIFFVIKRTTLLTSGSTIK